MIVGSIKENTELEKRVSITPDSAKNIIVNSLYIARNNRNGGPCR